MIYIFLRTVKGYEINHTLTLLAYVYTDPLSRRPVTFVRTGSIENSWPIKSSITKKIKLYKAERYIILKRIRLVRGWFEERVYLERYLVLNLKGRRSSEISTLRLSICRRHWMNSDEKRLRRGNCPVTEGYFSKAYSKESITGEADEIGHRK